MLDGSEEKLMENRLLGAALQWAKIIPIFPCRPNAKQPDTEHGFHDATTSVDQITKWWTDEPMRNLAACPDHGGFWVLDLDGKEGIETAELWQAMHGPFPRTIKVRTPGGGMHVWFRGQRPSGVKLGPGVDTRGVGGYVLLPPSIVDGREYVFISD